MLGKLKVLLKIVAAFIVLAVILFGIYRREYLSQAIPVYMQYLQMKHKWKTNNSGTYAFIYGDRCLPLSYYFIEDNRLKYIFRNGNLPESKYLIKGDKILDYISHGAFCTGFRNPKKILMEARFDEILLILWSKLWDKTSFENKNLQYPIEIGYDSVYGYPKGILIGGGGYEGCIRTGEGKPYFKFINFGLIMYKKHTVFSEKDIDKTLSNLQYISYAYKNNNDTFKKKNIVGGNIIKGYIIKKMD